MYWLGKETLAKIALGFGLSVFLIASTGFLPRKCVTLVEQRYKSLTIDSSLFANQSVFVHVLGAGHSSTQDLPATGQLGLTTLGRLAEALRICREIPESRLICSGDAGDGIESQASVVRRAAIALGFDSTRVQTLDKPRTTQEEAAALRAVVGTDNTVIIVTDAIHMTRAIYLFRKQGFNPIAAPTNFIIKKPELHRPTDWMPSVKNIVITDQLVHELLGGVKAQFDD